MRGLAGWLDYLQTDTTTTGLSVVGRLVTASKTVSVLVCTLRVRSFTMYLGSWWCVSVRALEGCGFFCVVFFFFVVFLLRTCRGMPLDGGQGWERRGLLSSQPHSQGLLDAGWGIYRSGTSWFGGAGFSFRV